MTTRLRALAIFIGSGIALSGCSVLDDFSDAMNEPLTPQQQWELDQSRSRQAQRDAYWNSMTIGAQGAAQSGGSATPSNGRPSTSSSQTAPRRDNHGCSEWQVWNEEKQKCLFQN